MKKRTAILVLFVVVMAIAGGIVWYFHESRTPITSYETCAKAGNPIQLSYPSVCRADGRSFVNPAEMAPEPPPIQ